MTGGSPFSSKAWLPYRRVMRGSLKCRARKWLSPGMGGRPQPPRVHCASLVACFLTIEPFETRVSKYLVRLAHATKWIDSGPRSAGTIPVEQQPKIKQQLIDLTSERHRLVRSTVSENHAKRPASGFCYRGAEWHSFASGHQYLEPLDNAVVGITLFYDMAVILAEAYSASGLGHLSLQQPRDVFPPPLLIHSGANGRISLGRRTSSCTWKNRWSGYSPPEIKPGCQFARLRDRPLFSDAAGD